jgi:PhnB protein
MADVKAVPEGYHTLTSYLVVKGAAKAIEFYEKAFGAKELYHLDGPGGVIAHAEIMIGDSHLMLADATDEFKDPGAYGGTPVSTLFYTEDCDAVFRKAIDLGAKEIKPLKDEWYGDRMGTIVDPFGHMWSIATHKEDVAPEEMEERMKKAYGG